MNGAKKVDTKVTKSMVVVDSAGLALGVRLYAASTYEIQLAEETWVTIW